MFTAHQFSLNIHTQCTHLFPNQVVIQSVFLLMQHEPVEQWAHSAASTSNTFPGLGPLKRTPTPQIHSDTFMYVCAHIHAALRPHHTTYSLPTLTHGLRHLNACMHVYMWIHMQLYTAFCLQYHIHLTFSCYTHPLSVLFHWHILSFIYLSTHIKIYWPMQTTHYIHANTCLPAYTHKCKYIDTAVSIYHFAPWINIQFNNMN